MDINTSVFPPPRSQKQSEWCNSDSVKVSLLKKKLLQKKKEKMFMNY